MSQPAFVPPADALETVPRDLRFHPTPNDAFNRDGYLKPFRIFDSAEMAAIRSYFDDLLARTLAAGGTSYSISTAHLRHGRVYDILREPRIVSHVRGLLGDNVIGWGSHFFCKMPGDGKRVSWHQDASYWPLSESKTVTVWLAIDDADVENACMRYLPRSHWHGHLTYTLTEDDDSNVLNQTVADAAQFGDPVDVELRAGEMSMHSDLLVHGSEPNQSARRRCGLTLRYCPAEVRAGLGWNAKGVVVSGSDPSGHWANPPRPTED